MVPLRVRRPEPVDAGLAALYAVVVLVEAFTVPEVERPVVHATAGGLAMALLGWRRVYPLTVAVAVEAALVILGWNGGGLSIMFALLIMAFTIGSETEGRRSWIGLGILALPYSAALFADARSSPVGDTAGDVAAMVTVLAVPWIAGRTLRTRAHHLAQALAHAERLELERERDVERATAQERVRLARELHDVVSHTISVIAIQVPAVRRRLQPQQVREATDLANLEKAAREAMAEMRRLLGVLREDGDGADLAPQPGLRELDRLVSQVEGAGLDVDVVTAGEPVELPPGLDLAAYRIVQEAMTNALRHSQGARVAVRLDYRPGELQLTVEDDGQGMRDQGRGEGSGHGLRGIRERAELYGGTLDVIAGDRGGTRICARLPVGGPR